MRTLWNVVSFLAVVHLLALLMFVGWLWQSQRLNGERLAQLRQMLSMTVPEAEAAAQKAAKEAQAEAQRLAEEELRANPPADSTTQIQTIALIKRQEELALRRLNDEKQMLLGQVAAASSQLQDQAATLNQKKSGWEAEIEAQRKRKTDEQFLQTVRQYEQVPPKQGKRMLVELINGGGMQRAVEYLDAMSPRAASRILKEFKTEAEIALATELLEQLRTFGIEDEQASDAPGVAKDAPNADDLANAAPGT